MKTKSIKDTVHGYITIDEPFWRVIDTAEFQRLKWIEQTSYRVLFPSARHDRFIHSLGVFHLGKRAIQGFLNNATSKNEKELIEKFKNSFLLACLLHDVGHAPFSHTCEDLYNYKDRVRNFDSKLNKELLSSIKDKTDKSDYDTFCSNYRKMVESEDEDAKKPSEHEIMSSIVICQHYDDYRRLFHECGVTEDLNLELMVRAIIGCAYQINRAANNEKKLTVGIQNCLIRLLNSSTVDVDKLDYIARDTKMTGYDNMVLDIDRLLSSVCIASFDGVFYPSFHKNALSILNNVVIAKNMQAKWIVNHPVVVYETHILRNAIGTTLKELADNLDDQHLSFDLLVSELFSSKSLSIKGNIINGNKFMLLSDIDIIQLMKRSIDKPIVMEFFSRDKRKKPIWKSLEEFLYHLDADMEKVKEITTFIAPLFTYVNGIENLGHSKHINQDLYDSLLKKNDINGKETIIQVLDILKNYKDESGSLAPFDYVLLQPNSKFSAPLNTKKLFIRFGKDIADCVELCKFDKTIDNKQSNVFGFFYVYSNVKIDAKHFINYLYDSIHTLEFIQV